MDKKKAILTFYENRIDDATGADALGISVSRYQHMRIDLGLKGLLWGKICVVCRCAFTTKLKLQVRCHDCCNMEKSMFIVRKNILFHLRELAEINLDEAKQFVFDMEHDDPALLDGIRDLLPEKVRCKNG